MKAMAIDDERLSKLLKDKNLLVIFCVTLMAVLGVASLTPAFPQISRELNISADKVGLLITVFTVPGVILTLLFGVLSDRFGRKKILVPSLILFGIAGGSCFFVRDFNILLILRLFEGVGAASLGSLNATIIGDLYHGRTRITALGYNASVISVGTAIYPLIGGVLATFGWYFPFLLPLLAIPIGLLVLFVLKNPEPKNEQHIKEYLLHTLISIKNPKVIGLFIVSVLTFVILYGPYLSYYPFLLSVRFNSPPYIIGILMSTASIASGTTSLFVGNFSKWIKVSNLIKIAALLYCLSLVIVPFIYNIWLLIIPALIFGVAQALNLPSVQTLLAEVAPINQRGAVMSLNGMVLRTGQTLGPLFVGPLYAAYSINGVFWGGACLAILMLIIVTMLIKESARDS